MPPRGELLHHGGNVQTLVIFGEAVVAHGGEGALGEDGEKKSARGSVERGRDFVGFSSGLLQASSRTSNARIHARIGIGLSESFRDDSDAQAIDAFVQGSSIILRLRAL